MCETILSLFRLQSILEGLTFWEVQVAKSGLHDSEVEGVYAYVTLKMHCVLHVPLLCRVTMWVFVCVHTLVCICVCGFIQSLESIH